VGQRTAPAQERPAVEPSPITPLLADELAAEPRVEVAQFPPPPFYSGPTYTAPPPFYQQGWRWPWESDTPVQPRSRREMRQQEIRPPNQLGQTARKRHWRERNGEAVAERQQREPSFALTRHMHGSYKDKISALLDQPQSIPQPTAAARRLDSKADRHRL
jgi:hypothetical protein